MEEAEALSDRIGIMKNGRVIVTGTAKSLMKQVKASTFEDAFVKIVTGEEL
jgi:ABC-2 type transport system ATP-binding protein